MASRKWKAGGNSIRPWTRSAAAVKESDVQAAYAAYRGFVQSYPELCDDVRLTDAMKQVSAVQQKAVKLVAAAAGRRA